MTRLRPGQSAPRQEGRAVRGDRARSWRRRNRKGDGVAIATRDQPRRGRRHPRNSQRGRLGHGADTAGGNRATHPRHRSGRAGRGADRPAIERNVELKRVRQRVRVSGSGGQRGGGLDRAFRRLGGDAEALVAVDGRGSGSLTTLREICDAGEIACGRD